MVLTGVLIFFVNYMVLPLFSMDVKDTMPVVKKPATDDTTSDSSLRTEEKSPFPSDYLIIAEQNLFHPDRKLAQIDRNDTQPLESPDFIVYGTLITDEIRIAYVENRKKPHRTKGGGTRQISLHEGDTLSGYTVKSISQDKVEFENNGDIITVKVIDRSNPKTRKTTTVTTRKPGKFGEKIKRQKIERTGRKDRMR